MIIEVPVGSSVKKYKVMLTKCLDTIDDCRASEWDRLLQRGEVREFYIVFEKMCDGDVDIGQVTIKLLKVDSVNDYGQEVKEYVGNVEVLSEDSRWYYRFIIDTADIPDDVYKVVIVIGIAGQTFIYDSFLLVSNPEFLSGFKLL